MALSAQVVQKKKEKHIHTDGSFRKAIACSAGCALAAAARAVEHDLRTIPGLGNIASSAALLRPEVAVRTEELREVEERTRLILQSSGTGMFGCDLSGKITFVNTLVQAGGEYKVWAEVENREENGQWLLRPGLNVTMQIHMR